MLFRSVSGRLNRYDGTTFTDLTASLNWGTNSVTSVKWNGSYWLIGGTNGKLAHYDGSAFTDRTTNLNWGTDSVKVINWGNSQWLIGGSNRRLATSGDGSSFTNRDISAYFQSGETVNAADYNAGLFSPGWYIGGSSGSLVIYNGAASFADYRNALFMELGGYYSVNAIKWEIGRASCRVRVC